MRVEEGGRHFFPGMDDAARGRRQSNLSRIGLWG
jgi:hypothetical protein